MELTTNALGMAFEAVSPRMNFALCLASTTKRACEAAQDKLVAPKYDVLIWASLERLDRRRCFHSVTRNTQQRA